MLSLPCLRRGCQEHKGFTPTLGADPDATGVRALAAYKDFLILWKDTHPHPIYKRAKA